MGVRVPGPTRFKFYLIMQYEIRYDYRTGNTFGSEDLMDQLLGEFPTLEVAQRNLDRIKEHYEFYEKIDETKSGRFSDKSWKELQKEVESLEEKRSKKDWYYKDYPNGYINLEVEDGKFEKYSIRWCGYFETLYAVRVKQKDLEYRFHECY